MSSYQRYHGVARQFSKLPREVVFQILDDLSLLKILELISRHDLPYIEECICGHFQLRNIFTPEFLQEVKGYFTVYLRLIDQGAKSDAAWLNYDATTFIRRKEPSIVLQLQTKIEKCLRGYYDYRHVLEDFVGYIDTTCFGGCNSLPELKEMVDQLIEAEMMINQGKVEKLEKMAQLMEQYPRTLRSRGDREQGVRGNEKHSIDWFHLLSRRVLRPQVLTGKIVGRCVFSCPDLYLVPYDRLLRTFLKVITRYPPTGMDSKKWKTTPRLESIPHSYPPEMKVVIDGMEKLHVRQGDDTPEVNYRTLHNEYAVPGFQKSHGTKQPMFWSTQLSKKEARAMQRDSDHIRMSGILPPADGEMEWLEAFLKTCRYISTGMDSLEWKAGQSVSEYWRIHAGVV